MKKYIRFSIALLLITLSAAHPQSVLVNELMPRNSSSFADEDGDWSDWIEIFNPTPSSIDLTGFGLTDDSQDPFKWTFPRVKLQPAAHMVIFASDKNRRKLMYWQTVIQRGDVWRYRTGTSEPPADWTATGFNDSDWMEGPSGFGSGDNDDATMVQNSLSVYVRKTFAVDNVKSIVRVVLHVDYDDAFIAFLNGREIVRANIGEPGQWVPYNRSASAGHEALLYQGMAPEIFEIVLTESLLHEGLNVLAMQVHNTSANSDLSLIPFLSFGRTSDTFTPSSVPEVLNLKSEYLHTNFKLKAGGETVAVFDPEGTVVDSVKMPLVPMNISYGRTSDGGTSWSLLAIPTPGALNNPTPFIGQTPPPLFSIVGGLYTGQLSLQLSDTSGGKIYYTLNGEKPDDQSRPYSAPLSLHSTTVVRARSFRPTLFASRIVTHTFILNEDSPFAIVCLTTDPDSLDNEDYGLFAMGPNASPEFPHMGANFWQDWERPVHVEFYEPDGQCAFALDAGMKVFGGWSRGQQQKSLAIFQRARYDETQINYQIFSDKDISHFESFILRNGGNDWDGTYWRDAFMQTLFRDYMDLDVMAFRPAHIYLNGEYWGILNVREKLNEHFVHANRGVDPDHVDVLDGIGITDSSVMAGSKDAYVALLNFLDSHNLSDPLNYAVADSLIDIDNFIDYQIAEIFIGNTDWPGNNLKYFRPQRQGGKWRWLIYDTDFGFYLYSTSYQHNTLAFAVEKYGPDWPNPPWSTFLLRKLLENEKFERKFINRFADHLNITFDPPRVHDLLFWFDDLYKSELDRQRNRWPGSMNSYDNRLQRMHTFADQRIGYVRTHIRTQFQIKSLIDVTLNVYPAGHGRIQVNSKVIRNFPWSGKYFQDIPISLTAIPDAGYRFVEWSSAGLLQSMTVDYPSQQNLDVTAVFEQSEQSVGVVINEINYNSGSQLPAKDWVELYNPNHTTISLGGWKLRDQTDGNSYVLPNHAIVPAFGFTVLCVDTTLVKALYPRIGNVYGNLSFNFSNGGDQVKLYNSTGQLVDSLAFDDAVPWPVEADGEDYSLELIEPWLDNALPHNWIASAAIGGSPGGFNSRATPVVERATAEPALFELRQNYPNPFNAETRVRYTLANSGQTTLTIFDLLGRRVATLVDHYQMSGANEIHWKPDVASGVYFYRLTCTTSKGTESMLKKMLLLR